jgi:hypothetical protein
MAPQGQVRRVIDATEQNEDVLIFDAGNEPGGLHIYKYMESVTQEEAKELIEEAERAYASARENMAEQFAIARFGKRGKGRRFENRG